MIGGDDGSTTDAPAVRDGASRPSLRAVAASRRAAERPTLEATEKDRRAIYTAARLMKAWSVTTIAGALSVAEARVRGAWRRAGYDRED